MLYKLTWRNLWRNKRRTLITVTAITFAVVLTTIMRSMQLGSYERMLDNGVRFYTGYIQIHKNGYWNEKIIDNSFRNDKQLLGSIEAIENVNAAVPRIESFALASYGVQTKGALILGIDPGSRITGYGIIKDHGGDISVHRASSGGAKFVIELPLDAEAAVALEQAS